jgi:Fe-S-cluster containining protein
MKGGPERTCPGWCCAAFYWPTRLSDMRRHPERYYDGSQIADMLIPLTPKEARKRYEKFSGRTTGAYTWKHRGHWFTCKNWDEETRLCKIYEDRPQMCRDYPYGKECQHGCGLECGVPSEERQKIREEKIANQWKAYAAPNPPKEHV